MICTPEAIETAPPLWEHPAISGRHVVAMTRGQLRGGPTSVATCQCGWRVEFPIARKHPSAAPEARECAVNRHWREMIVLAAHPAPEA